MSTRILEQAFFCPGIRTHGSMHCKSLQNPKQKTEEVDNSYFTLCRLRSSLLASSPSWQIKADRFLLVFEFICFENLTFFFALAKIAYHIPRLLSVFLQYTNLGVLFHYYFFPDKMETMHLGNCMLSGTITQHSDQ